LIRCQRRPLEFITSRRGIASQTGRAPTVISDVADLARPVEDTRRSRFIGQRQLPAQLRDAAREAVMTVNDILLDKGNQVVTIEPAATVAAAVRKLAERRIGALLVTGADRHIVGIISEVMTRKVVTCDRHDTIAEIMERMTTGKFRHVPVVEHGRLTGIVSIGDVVKVRLRQLEHEQKVLCEYIGTA
jgi:CBS domain-containing protein